jgi:hypothetical protein
MKKLALAVVLVGSVALAGVAMAQGRGGGGGGGMHGGGGGGGGGWSGGGSGGGGWHGGGSGGGWHGGGGYHGGGWYGGGYRGWYGGWYGPGLGIYVGAPGYWGWGGWPYYAASYPVYSTYPAYGTAEVGASGTYLQSAPEPAPNQASYWYYCTEPAGYYPYVQNCSRAWMQVVPQNTPGMQVAPAPSAQ